MRFILPRRRRSTEKFFKILLVTLLYSLFTIHHSLSQSVWTQIADFPGDARSACTAFSFDDAGCVGLGYDGTSYRRSFYLYYPDLNSWAQVASMGGNSGDGLQRDVAAGFTIGNKAYVGTGQGGANYLFDFWEYDHATDTWTQKANFSGGARRSAVGFSVGDFGYVGLGQDATGFKKDLWKYDTTANAWTQQADFPGTARRLAVNFKIDSLVYVGTGDDGTFTGDFYSYDASANVWTQKANFAGSPRYGATAFAVNHLGYVGLGYDTTLQNVKDFWQYNPVLDSWTSFTDFPSARSNAVSFNIGISGYVGTGYDTAFHSDFWKNDVATGTSFASASIAPEIFPNPIRDQATIILKGNFSEEVPAFRIFDSEGKEVSDKIDRLTIASDQQKISYQFQRGKLTTGIYTFRVSGREATASGKFIVINF